MESIRNAIETASGYLREHPDAAAGTDAAATAVLEEGLRFRVAGPAGELTTDMSESVGGGATAPTPAWLQRAALASCDATLVAMEAAACGTPVVALGRGALPEVVAEGITGFVAQSTDEMISALRQIGDIDAKGCRRYAEENYSAQRMADRYEGLYRRLLTSEKTQTARH